MKYFYKAKTFTSDITPKCNLCKAELQIKRGYSRNTIIDCINDNCVTNKPEVKRIDRFNAFLPPALVESYIAAMKLNFKYNRPNSIHYWLKRGYSEEDGYKQMSIVQSGIAKQVKNHFKGTKENLLARGFSEEEIYNMRLLPNNVDFWLKRGHSIDEATAAVKKHQSKAGKAFADKRKANPEKYDAMSTTQFKYWMKLGHTETEAKALVKERQATFTLEKCIKQHGEVEGTKIFEERQRKWKIALQKNFENYGDGRSPSSQFASSMIESICNELQMDIPKKERWINGGDIKCSYDFTHKEKRKIIEFNGDYWHCNPIIYNETDIIRGGKTATEVWDYDKRKAKLANDKGYEVLVIWEREWNDSKTEALEKCMNFLN